MLALKQALSLVSTKSSSSSSSWSPVDESSLEAWYQKGVGITLDPGVSRWDDSSSNGNTMAQNTADNQPSYADGILTFTATETDYLILSGADITLADTFTIGVRLNITSAGGIILGDNTEDGEFIKVFSSTKLRIKIDNATAVDIQLDSGSLLASESYMVLTRAVDTDVITLHWNGVAQVDTETMTGTSNIDSIGVRKTNLNPYDGTIREIQIYSSTSADLTANVNTRLASL
jgi:hypothetical protein